MPPVVHLGPYVLVEPVGRGGTGEVWRAVHAELGTTVAVKVVAGDPARRRTVYQSLRNEVRATVALDHPHIAGIFDLGTVPRDAEALSGGALVANSPYLVMEYAHGGTLHAHGGRLRWPDLRTILLALLDALGHAHARALIHRDVKPANVLLTIPGDFGAGLRLADFGLARGEREDRTDATDPVVGTPRYMAPEQILGRWRDQGPWTDLYGLGRTTLALLMGPLEAPWVPPALPLGFAGWMRRMLAFRPHERFQLAADAAFVLRKLPAELDEDLGAIRELIDPAVASHHPARAERRLPPMPPDVPPDPVGRPRQAMQESAEVYSLRQLPLIGRSTERRALWDALRAVRDDGRGRAVVIEGPEGVGKTRLVQWISERAAELGAALVLRATAGPGEDALSRMLARHLGCVGLAPQVRQDRIKAIAAEQGVDDAYEVEALAELIRPGSAPRGDDVELEDDDDDAATEERITVRFASPEERWALALRALKRLSRVRPVLVAIDDAQCDPDALGFVAHAIGGAHGILLVIGARDDDLVGREALNALSARAKVLQIKPLPDADHRRLLGQLQVHDPDLVARIADRTAGNPQFTVQIVRSLVQRGALVWRDAGWYLRFGGKLELPDDLHAAWRDRIERLVEDLPKEAGWWLERAAILGHEVDMSDWRLVCDDPRASRRGRTELPTYPLPPGEVVRAAALDRLQSARFATPTEDGFVFANAMVRETLERRAREAGRATAHHRACAALLAWREGPGVDERRGRHLIEAGKPEAALEPWFRAVGALGESGDPSAALRLLDQLEAAMTSLALPTTDIRWGQLWKERAAVRFLAGDYDEVGPLTERLEDAAIAHGWTDLRVHALLLRARPLLGRGRLGEAVGWCEEAVALAEGWDAELLGVARTAYGLALVVSGDVDRAIGVLEVARDGLRAAADGSNEAFADKALATAFRQKGRLDDAARAFDRAGERLLILGHRYAAFECLNGLGDVKRLQGDLRAAEEAYREALIGCAALGAWHARVIQVNLALVLIAQRRYLEAYALLADDLDDLEQRGLAWLLAAIHVACLPCTAAAGDGRAWERHLARGRALLGTTAFRDVDVAQMAELAGDIWAERGVRALATDAWALAESQWTACQRPEDAERTARKQENG